MQCGVRPVYQADCRRMVAGWNIIFQFLKIKIWNSYTLWIEPPTRHGLHVNRVKPYSLTLVVAGIGRVEFHLLILPAVDASLAAKLTNFAQQCPTA